MLYNVSIQINKKIYQDKCSKKYEMKLRNKRKREKKIHISVRSKC